MSTVLQFTDDELAQLHLLVAQDAERSRVELHHTSGIPYREYIKQRITQGNSLLKKMNEALPNLALVETPAD
jgi:hypothetical protein